MKTRKRTAYPKWHRNPVLVDFIREFEQSHFRTTEDTGANPSAMMLWNCARHRVGLPLIGPEDLPTWDAKKAKYVLPKGSKLTGVPAK